MRVAIYAIALNEIGQVQRFLSACAGADAIVVADTGSTDGTQDALRRGRAAARSSIRSRQPRMSRTRGITLLP